MGRHGRRGAAAIPVERLAVARSGFAGASPATGVPDAIVARTDVTRRWRALLAGLLAAAAGCLAGLLVSGAGHPAAAPARPTITPHGGSSWAQVSALAQLAISRALGADDHGYWPRRIASGSVAQNHAQRLSASFTAAGVIVRARGAQLGLSLRTISAGRARIGEAASPPVTKANRASYRRGALSEWYANGPLGLEQGFSLARPLAPGTTTLSLSFALSGSLRPRALPRGAGLQLLAPDGKVALRYGQLSAFDARGRALAAGISLAHGRMMLHVRTAGARYPITIDPIFQEGRLSASNAAAFEEMGSAVAISGSTIALGAPAASVNGHSYKQGAVYVFTKPAGGWGSATQTAELSASDANTTGDINGYGDELGASVAISGQTIVAGAVQATSGGIEFAGKVYVFVEPLGGWVNATQNAELGATDATKYNYLGTSLATDGTTVLVGDPSPQPPFTAGEAYVFTKPGGGWTSETETAKLTASDGATGDAFGRSVAISGNVAAVGALYAKATSPYQGAVYVYSRAEGKAWSEATQAKLTASEGKEYETLGGSVALEGSTLVAGAPNNASPGSTPSAAYIFVKPGGGWANTSSPAARLTPSDPLSGEHFGGSVGLSGKTVVVASQFAAFGETAQQGAIYVYTEPGGGWASTSSATKISAAGGGLQQASSAGVSGSTIVEGADLAKVGANEAQGAAYVFGAEEKKETKKEEEERELKEKEQREKEEKAERETKEREAREARERAEQLKREAEERERASREGLPPPTTPKTAAPPATSAGGTTLNYVAKPTYIPPEVGWGDIAAGLFGIKPGSGQTVNWGQFVFIAACKKSAGQCAGSGTFAGENGAHLSSAATSAKAPPIYGKVSFSIPANKSKSVVVKLSKAASAVLKNKHKLSGVLTVIVNRPGAAPAKLSHKLTIRLVSKRKH